ncbi:MAG: hypothetical protein ACRDTT_13875 [Pseudonocardiaceae bacterium]
MTSRENIRLDDNLGAADLLLRYYRRSASITESAAGYSKKRSEMRKSVTTLVSVLVIMLFGLACSPSPTVVDPPPTSPSVIGLPDGFQAEGIAVGR